MASWRFAPRGRTSRRAIGGSRSSPQPRSTKRDITNSATRLKPVDAEDFDKGFDFDGRISEDFKLGSGTWVSVGPLRARFVAACAPLVRDVVIAGINRDELSALVILDLDGCRVINPALPAGDLAAAASDSLSGRHLRSV